MLQILQNVANVIEFEKGLKMLQRLLKMSSMLQILQNAANVADLQRVANVADLQRVSNVAELSKLLQMLQTSQNVNKCCKCAGFPRRFRTVALVLGTDQDNLQSLMPFKHIPFLLLLLRWPSETSVSCAM